MFRVEAVLDDRLFRSLRTSLPHIGVNREDAAAKLSDIVASSPQFGPKQHEIAGDPTIWFELDYLAEPDFWPGQDRLYEHVVDCLTSAATLIEPYFPPVKDDLLIKVTVLPVPALTNCYGAGDGRQVFGLRYDADPAEAVLFLAHTYYHELSEHLDYGLPDEPPPDRAEALRRLIMQLIRNEGIANYAVLTKLRELRARHADVGYDFKYFDYAGLIDNPAASSRALTACRELLAQITPTTVDRLLPRVEASFKNPKLPIINLVGIHLAEAIARFHGEQVLLDVNAHPPEDFFRDYEATGDPLREYLLGSDSARKVSTGP